MNNSQATGAITSLPEAQAHHVEPARSDSRRRWLVLYCRSRFEFKVYAALLSEAIEVFFPTRVELRQWSDRKKRITAPLFPGYLFVHVDERERVSALEKSGALTYVRFGEKYAEVAPQVIQSLRIAASKPEHISVERTAFQPGQPVTVLDGPFAGMKGTLLEMRGTRRVAVSVEAIAQTVLVEVHQSSISLQKTENL